MRTVKVSAVGKQHWRSASEIGRVQVVTGAMPVDVLQLGLTQPLPEHWHVPPMQSPVPLQQGSPGPHAWPSCVHCTGELSRICTWT